MSVISAGTTTTTAFKVTGDTTGTLQLQTGAVPTTAINISATQVVTFPATTTLDFTGTLLLGDGSAAAPTLAHSGDTNTGIYFPGADQIAITTAGTQRVYVGATGDVGIGTGSPAYKLDVRGVTASGNGTITTGLSWDTRGLVGTFSNHNLGFLTNGSVRATLDTAGNLGLGVTPSSWDSGRVVEINQLGTAVWGNGVNNLWITSNAYYNGGNFKYGTGGGNLANAYQMVVGQHRWYLAPAGTNAGDTITFTQAMTLDASGNLGVGTTSPGGVRLNVTAGNGNQLILDNTGQRFTQLDFRNNTAQRGIIYFDETDDVFTLQASTGCAITFNTNGASERARITSDGNFLVNTTTAGNFRLNVNGPSQTVCGFSSYTANGVFDANARPSTVITPAGGTLRFGYFDEGFGQYNPAIGFRAGSVLGVGQTNYSNAIWATTNGGIAFGTGTAGTTTERARVASNGTFCVNTTNAAFFLNVHGSNAAHFGDDYDGANYGVVQISRPANQGSAFHLSFIRTGQQIAGMGFLNNSNTFAVQVGANNGSAGVTLVNGGTSWGSTSDEREKNILGNVDNAMAKMASWRSVYYRYKIDKEDAPQRIGLIAQDVQVTVPEAISVGDDEAGTLQLRYSEVIPVLVKAIQELSAKVAALESK